MPFRFSREVTRNQPIGERMILDLRDSPIRGRDTKFRLAQQNIEAYTFGAALPGWASGGLNSMSFKDVVARSLQNARDEGSFLYGDDFEVKPNAIAKVTGDIYETLTSAILWDVAARWNSYMLGRGWPATPRYPRPTVSPSPRRQVGVLNLPRRYDWVRLLEPNAKAQIDDVRAVLAVDGLGMPTSTPDIAVIVLPEGAQTDELWRTPLGNLSLASQAVLSTAHGRVAGQVEPGEIILAMALKTSLRSDRLYQPLYEANVMQFLLEGRLGAPKVEFEVHVLSAEGTKAVDVYRAATLHSAGTPAAHRAVRDMYQPTSASDIISRFLGFLNDRMGMVAA